MRLLIEQQNKKWYNFLRNEDLSRKLSELEELTELSDDDYTLVSDMSEQKSMKVRLGTLRKFLQKS